MNTDLTLVDPALYTVLKKKQQDFIHLMDAACLAAIEFTRGEPRRSPTTTASHGPLRGS